MKSSDKQVYSSNDLLGSHNGNAHHRTMNTSVSHYGGNNAKSKQASLMQTMDASDAVCTRNLLMSRTKDQDYQKL